MRGLFTLLLGLIYLPVFLVGVPGIYLFRTCNDGPALGDLIQECGVYDAALAGLERLGEHDESLRRLPKAVRQELFDAIREAVPPEFLRDETVRFHAAVQAWIERPIVPLDFRIDLEPVRERAAASLADKRDLMAIVPDCQELQTPETDGCLPLGLNSEQRAEVLVSMAFRDIPAELDLGTKINSDAQEELTNIGRSFSQLATLVVVAWILLIGIPLLVLLLNLNHPGRMLRRVGLVVLVPAVLATVLAHLSEIAVGLEIAEKSEQLAREEQTPLEFSEAQMIAAGQRLTSRLFSGQLTVLYLLDGAALLLIIGSAFVGLRRSSSRKGQPGIVGPMA